MLLGLQCAGQQPGAAIANLAAAVWQKQNWCIQPIGKKKLVFQIEIWLQKFTNTVVQPNYTHCIFFPMGFILPEMSLEMTSSFQSGPKLHLH